MSVKLSLTEALAVVLSSRDVYGDMEITCAAQEVIDTEASKIMLRESIKIQQEELALLESDSKAIKAQ